MFGATGKSAREWRQAGAPILLLGAKPVTRLDDLWFWLLDNKQAVEVTGDMDGDLSGLEGMSAAQAKKAIGDSGEKALVAAVLGKNR